MRRFNLDELIWFILLSLLTTLWGYLIFSGDIYELVNPRMVKYSYFAFISFIILTIFQLNKIITFPSRVDMSSRFIPLIFTLFMSLAYITLNSSYPSNSELLLTENDVIFDYEESYISIESNNNKHDLLKNLHSDYIGETISLVGYIERPTDLPQNTFLISRDEISCCLQDLSAISILCKEIDTTYMESGSWIKAIGTIALEDGNFYLKLIEIQEIQEPEKKYYSSSISLSE